MKRYVQLSLITIGLFLAAIAGWHFTTTVQVADAATAEFNMGDKCESNADCKVSGCDKEYCGVKKGDEYGGVICGLDISNRRHNTSSCTCLHKECVWSRQLFKPDHLIIWGSKIFK